MRRREFITLLGGAAATWPSRARAQQAPLPVVGMINTATANGFQVYLNAFRKGLSETGFVEGQTVTIEYRWGENESSRLPALAADLVNRRVAVIATLNNASTIAVKSATSTIPIVFSVALDPVATGLVSSLNRPNGNLTGVTTLNVEVAPKRIELLHEALSRVAILGLLINPTNPSTEDTVRDLLAAAQILGVKLQVYRASNDRDLDDVFESLVENRLRGLIIGSDIFFVSRSEKLAALTLRHKIPAVFQGREYVAAGGLMSYGNDNTEGCRIAGVYTGRILKGDKPSELPVQRVITVELIVNLKTAKALGLTLPLTLLGRADEVIE